jgi:hypothetical protein
MHLHGNPKGNRAKFVAAGQPCKIGEDNFCDGREQFLVPLINASDFTIVVPANACERRDP